MFAHRLGQAQGPAASKLDLTGRCPQCLARHVLCVCAELPRVETRTRFIFLQHQREYLKTTNTARVAHLSLPNSELCLYGEQRRALDVPALTQAGTWLLYPGKEASPHPAEPPHRVLVLDGSWSQSRRMLQRIPELNGLPRLSLLPRERPVQRMRKPLLPEGMSTLEAVAEVVSLLEGEEKGSVLREFHDRMAERVLRVSGKWMSS